MIYGSVKYEVIAFDKNGEIEACLIVGGEQVLEHPRAYMFIGKASTLPAKGHPIYNIVRLRFGSRVAIFLYDADVLEDWLKKNKGTGLFRVMRMTTELDKLFKRLNVCFDVETSMVCQKCYRKYSIF